LTHADTAAKGTTLVITLKLRNNGWARFHHPRFMAGVAIKSGAANIPCTSSQDLRTLRSNGTSSQTVQVNCKIPSNATSGVYALSLSAPDNDPSLANLRPFAVRFANNDSGGMVWDDVNGRMSTGTTFTVP
jgi:hypothetical protein